METALGWVTQYGAVSLFFLMMLGIVGLPIPDETLLVFSGYLIHKGAMNPIATFGFAFFGAMAGITLSYYIGRVYGFRLAHKYGRFFHLTEARFLKAHSWFESSGRWSLFFGYYIAGVRHFTAMAAGASALEYPVFARFAYSGAFVWVLSFLSLGYLIGDQWQRVSENVHQYLLIAAGVLAGIAAIYFLARRIMKKS